MNIQNHFGVYGICKRENQLLCVAKQRGPYKGRFDLPGGSQEMGESLIETLRREVKEETGYCVLKVENNRIFDAFIKPRFEDVTVHHVFAVYDIEINQVAEEVKSYVAEGDQNDSDGAIWVDIDTLTQTNASPLILRVLETTSSFEAERYMQWEVQR